MPGSLTSPRSERLVKILCLPLLAWNLAIPGLTLANLVELSGHRKNVVDETVQPEAVTLWLRKDRQ